MTMSSAMSLFVFGILLGTHTSDGCMCSTQDLKQRYCDASAVVMVKVEEVIPQRYRNVYSVTVKDVLKPHAGIYENMRYTLNTGHLTSCERQVAVNEMYIIGVFLYRGFLYTGYCSLLIDPMDQPNWLGSPNCPTNARRDTYFAGNPAGLNDLLGIPESQHAKKDIAFSESRSSKDAMQLRDLFGLFEKKSAIPDKRNALLNTRSSQDDMQLRDLFGLFEPVAFEKKSVIPNKHNSVFDTRSPKDAMQLRDLFGIPVLPEKRNDDLDTRDSKDDMQLRDMFGLFEQVASEKTSVIPDKRKAAVDIRSSKVLRDLLDAFDTLSKKSPDPVARNIGKQTQGQTRKALRELLYDILR